MTLLANADYQTDKSLAEGVVAAMEQIGIRVIVNVVTGHEHDRDPEQRQVGLAGATATGSELISVVQNTDAAGADRPADQLVPPRRQGRHRRPDALRAAARRHRQQVHLRAGPEQERIDLMKQYQKLYTENVYAVGLTQYPGALIINKRFANIPAGAPIFMFNWAEDNIIRERVFVPNGQAAEIRAASRHAARARRASATARSTADHAHDVSSARGLSGPLAPFSDKGA